MWIAIQYAIHDSKLAWECLQMWSKSLSRAPALVAPQRFSAISTQLMFGGKAKKKKKEKKA